MKRLLIVSFLLLFSSTIFGQKVNGWYSILQSNCVAKTNIVDTVGFEGGVSQSFSIEVKDSTQFAYAIWEKEVDPIAKPNGFYWWFYLNYISKERNFALHKLYVAGEDRNFKLAGTFQSPGVMSKLWQPGGAVNPTSYETINWIRIEVCPYPESFVSKIEWFLDYLTADYDLEPLFLVIDEFGDTITSVGQSETPEKFQLFQNYPNPFNPVTTVQFSISEKSNVNISVFDILGRKIEVLMNEEKYPGVYTVPFDGKDLPSGVYLYRLTADGYTKTKKMQLLK